jgi:hypothetical protein
MRLHGEIPGLPKDDQTRPGFTTHVDQKVTLALVDFANPPLAHPDPARSEAKQPVPSSR